MSISSLNRNVVLEMDNLEETIDTLFSRFDEAFSAAAYEHKHSAFHCKSDSPIYPDIVDTAVSEKLDWEGDRCSILVTANGENTVSNVTWGERYYSERDVEARLTQSKYRMHYLPDLGFWQFFDKETRKGLQIMRGHDGFPKWDPGSPLRNFFHWCLNNRSCGLTHAGTLAVDGIGIMLAGPGGSGKSGTVLSGLMNGLDSVGDDYVLARIEQGKIFASPLFTTLKQDPEGMRRLALDRNDNISKTVNWQGKYQFHLDDVSPTNNVEKIEIRALCIPNISGEETTGFQSATHKDAFLALAPSGVSQIPGDRDNTFHVCATLARSLPCYKVNLSADPREISEKIETFISHELL